MGESCISDFGRAGIVTRRIESRQFLRGGRTRGPLRIDFVHDLLSFCNRIRDAKFERWARPVDLSELPRREDARGNQQNTLAAFIHEAEGIIFRFCFAMH
jgi:hypothetical protein